MIQDQVAKAFRELSSDSGSGLPAGFLGFTAAKTAPDGWLVRDGSKKKRSDYPDLFNAIGVTYNTGGEAADEFRLPDGLGRSVIGSGAGSGLTSRAVGVKVGEEAHVLATSEIPAHQHYMYNTDQVGNTDVIPDANTYAPWWVFNSGFNESYLARGTSTPSTLVLTSLTGGGGSHNNMQPSIAHLPIIKT
jgi:microcystin-dependent protein